jgi:hypothetical protein
VGAERARELCGVTQDAAGLRAEVLVGVDQPTAAKARVEMQPARDAVDVAAVQRGLNLAEVRACLAPALAEFAQVEPALVRAGIPAEPGFLDIDAETLAATFRFASRLRARYTVIDFLEGQGALEPALQAILPARARRDSGSASPPHPR